MMFLHTCATSVNIGDVLIQIAADTTAQMSVRMNAALAVETLFTPSAWGEGKQFSDKAAIVPSILGVLSAPEALPVALVEPLTLCVAKIIVCEFPSPEWTAYIQNIVMQLLNGSATTFAALRAMAVNASHNYELWHYLAHEVTAVLLQNLPSGVSATRKRAFEVLLHLMRSRPRPTSSPAASIPPHLLSDAMTECILSQLQRCVQCAAQEAQSDEAEDFFAECEVLLAISQRLVKNDEAANTIFRSGSFFLVSCQQLSVADPSALDSSMIGLIENSLECLLSVLQTFPAISEDNRVDHLLSSLLCFMGYSEESLAIDALEILTGVITDDEVVPLGCASGDVPSLAGSVLELFLEANPQQLTVAVVALISYMKSMIPNASTISPMQWTSIARAMRCVARVCEANYTSVIEMLPTEQRVEMMQCYVDVLAAQRNECSLALLLESLSFSCTNTSDVAVCVELERIFENTFNTYGDTSLVSVVCVHAVGTLVRGRLKTVRREWLSRSLAQTVHSSDHMHLLCGASTACALVMASPLTAEEWSTFSNPILAAVGSLCSYCQTRSVGNALLQVLRHFYWHAAPGPVCPLAARLADSMMLSVQTQSSSQALVVRTLAECCLLAARGLLDGKGCESCGRHLLSAAMPTIVTYMTAEGPFDEGTSRILSSSTATSAAALHGGSTDGSGFAATATLLVHCMREGHSCNTVHAVGAALAIHGMLQPSFLDSYPTALVEEMFPAGLLCGRQGVNYIGCCVTLALFVCRQPGWILRLVTASEQSITATAAWQRGLGWCFSLAPFADAFALRCFLLSWATVLEDAEQWPVEQRALLRAPLASCTVYLLPSVLVKQLPPAQYVSEVSFARGLVTALHSVATRATKTTKVTFFDQTTVTRLSSEGLLPPVDYVSNLARSILSSDLIVGCQLLSAKMSSLGFDDELRSVGAPLSSYPH